MAVKQVELKQGKNFKEMARKVALASVGAFGVAADELGKLFELFVERGERMQKDSRKLTAQSEKQVRQLANELQPKSNGATAKANKSVKKAVKKVEQALA